MIDTDKQLVWHALFGSPSDRRTAFKVLLQHHNREISDAAKTGLEAIGVQDRTAACEALCALIDPEGWAQYQEGLKAQHG